MNLGDIMHQAEGTAIERLDVELLTVGRQFYDVQANAEAVDLFVHDDSHADSVILRANGLPEGVELKRGARMIVSGAVVHRRGSVVWLECSGTSIVFSRESEVELPLEERVALIEHTLFGIYELLDQMVRVSVPKMSHTDPETEGKTLLDVTL